MSESLIMLGVMLVVMLVAAGLAAFISDVIIPAVTRRVRRARALHVDIKGMDAPVLICVEHIYPPIPNRHFDYVAFLDGFEEDGMYGYGASAEDAIEDLRGLLDDNEILK